MNRISASEFLTMISENPSVFEHWDSRLEITEYVDCINSPITHLSRNLTFSGKNDSGDVACFRGSSHLCIATGTYYGGVFFSKTGIEKIEDLTVTNYNKNGLAASFFSCKSLEIATGNYPGFVNFSRSGISKIENLIIEFKNTLRSDEADFFGCENLKTLDGWNIKKPCHIEPKKLAAEKERRALQKFHKEAQPTELPFL
jgi:hypothetical protein